VTIRILNAGDTEVLERVAPDVFDHPIQPAWAHAFLSDPRHHIAVAIDENVVIGFASGFHYVHPDKPAELFVNEVGVAPRRQGQGLGPQLVRALLDQARALGCREAWVLTDPENTAARRAYAKAGGMKAATLQVMATFSLQPDPR
jgi:ribosomal protein S18 acetylase RimI-like enzyme